MFTSVLRSTTAFNSSSCWMHWKSLHCWICNTNGFCMYTIFEYHSNWKSVIEIIFQKINSLSGTSKTYLSGTCQVLLPFRKTWADWKVGQRGTWWASETANVEFCTWWGVTACISAGWVLTCWKGALQRRTWVCWWTNGWPWASSIPLWTRRPMGSWGVITRMWPAGQGR